MITDPDEEDEAAVDAKRPNVSTRAAYKAYTTLGGAATCREVSSNDEESDGYVTEF